MKSSWMKIVTGLIVLLAMTGLVGCDDSSKDEGINESQNEGILQSDTPEDEHSAGERDGDDEKTEPDQEETEKERTKTNFFWKVDHRGNTVYMLGSVHVGDEAFYPMHEQIETAFERSQILAVEADIVNFNPLEAQKVIKEKAMYTDGTTLEDHLSPELYEDLQNRLKSYGIPIEMVKPFEPWYLVMLLEGLDMQQSGYNEQFGVDYYFLDRADGKEIIELEGMDFQLDMFDSFSEEVQVKLLELTVNRKGDIKQETEQLLKLWKQGEEKDLAELIKSDGDGSKEYETYMNALLDERNLGMAKKIEGFLNDESQETYFVIVGAAHYPGENGIIHLLREKGYDVEKQF